MRHGSLFSGIGGFDLAAEWMGWENVFHCEWNLFGQKILKHYWPKAISYENICTTDFSVHRGHIDILTGGFPCQPYSSAGKRLGKEDERHLWPEMLRAIREIEPTFIVGENVRGLLNWNGGMVFEEVCAELENIGYQVAPCLIPACGKDAPHRRERIWFVAKNPKRDGFIQREIEQKGTKVWEQRNTCTGDSIGFCLSEGNATNSNSNGQHKRNCTNEINTSEGGVNAQRDIVKSVEYGTSFNPSGERLKGSISPELIGQFPNEKIINEINLLSNRRRREELSFERFPTQSPVCGGDDGLPTELDGITFPKWRQESIKGYGNAIVPQVAFEIFKAIEKTITQ